MSGRHVGLADQCVTLFGFSGIFHQKKVKLRIPYGDQMYRDASKVSIDRQKLPKTCNLECVADILAWRTNA